MARNGADVLSQKNNKLDAFLKRHLDVETFESLRAKEPCIVCSEKEDKAFKFVILSDEWIYLTENPPKKIEPVVHLRDLVEITLVPDFPDFLQGQERECAQHIVIRYLTDEEKKGKKRPKSANGAGNGKESLQTPRSARSLSVTARNGPRPNSGSLSARDYTGNKKTDQLHTSRSASGRLDTLTKSVNDGDLNHKLKKSKSLVNAKADSDTKHSRGGSLKAETLRDALSGKPPKGNKKGSKKNKTDVNQNENNNDTLEESKMSTEMEKSLRNRYSSSDYDYIRTLPRALPNPSEEWDENGEYTDKRKKEPLKLGYSYGGELKLNLDGLDDDEDGCDEEDDDIFDLPQRVKRRSLGSTGSETDMTDATLDDLEEEEEEECLREGVLHLYILSYSSPLLMLIKSAWDNYLIRGTLEEDLDFLIKRGDLLGKKTKASEKLEKLFGQLKTELIDPDNTMEGIFNLASELKNAAERNCALKKLFWKTPDLFVFCVKQLQRYLPKSPYPQTSDSSEAKQERADEFELVNLILEILALMFRETETSSSRVNTLKAGAGKSVLDLIVTLLCFPELPQRYVPPSSKVQTLLKTSQSDQWKCMADVELSKLVEEFTHIASVILFELILISHQANWGDATGSFLNMSWIMKILEEVNTTEKFVERLISQAMRLISPSREEELAPSQAVQVYQQFFVLQTLVEYSPRTVTFIRSNFFEEFQYYIHAPVIVKKLPTKYLIRKNTIKLIQQVMSTVLQKKIKLIRD